MFKDIFIVYLKTALVKTALKQLADYEICYVSQMSLQ